MMSHAAQDTSQYLELEVGGRSQKPKSTKRWHTTIKLPRKPSLWLELEKQNFDRFKALIRLEGQSWTTFQQNWYSQPIYKTYHIY